MLRRKHQKLATIYWLHDAVASSLALLAAYYLRFAIEVIPLTKGTQALAVYTHILPLVSIVFPLAFAVQGLYRMRASRPRVEELVQVAVGTLLGTVLLSGLLLWIRPGNGEADYSRATLGLFALCELVIVIAGRSLLRMIVERRHRSGRSLERVIVAGSGELAREVAVRIESHRELGLELVGFLGESEMTGCRRLGTIDEAPLVIERERIEHVFVALPHDAPAAMMALLDQLVRQCVSIHVVPDLLQFMTLRSRVEDLDGLPTINLSETPLEGWSRFIKRGFDVLFALVALILLSPVMIVVALWIYLDDRGPVFYRQVRMGLDGAPFDILKFRSMKVEAEKATGAVWAARDDSRRTAPGELIRRWSLDELPQLWNVLRGEMSLVGPRPERPHFVEQFRAEFPHYMLRHKVRSGITGWAQVHGWRGNTSIRMRIEHDLYYIQNWSLMLDVKILLMTLRHGFRHENAY